MITIHVASRVAAALRRCVHAASLAPQVALFYLGLLFSPHRPSSAGRPRLTANPLGVPSRTRRGGRDLLLPLSLTFQPSNLLTF